MAESAPLTSAHNHARSAAAETQQTHWARAAEEHQHASEDFARAAKGSSDVEALRVLRLLEAEHRKLAHLIRDLDTAPREDRKSESAVSQPDVATVPIPTSTSQTRSDDGAPTSASPSKAKSMSIVTAKSRTGSEVRDSSPSLARDIASRRGIPQPGWNPPSAAARARVEQLSPGSQRRSQRATTTPKIPPSIVDSRSSLREASTNGAPPDDDGFARFYSSITSGTMSKLSSALAYAGLPLNVDETKQDLNAAAASERRTVRAANEPDVKKIFSKAALDAIEDEHRQRGTLGRGFAPSESFYIVQKGGGTYSYADIAKAKQQQQLSSIGEDDDNEAFVDAKEIPGPPSPRYARSLSHGRGSFGSPRTQEELELENTTLKQTLEHVAGRLAAFEAHAQDASMAALTQSMIGFRSPSSATTSGTGGPVASDATLSKQLRQLEAQVEMQAEEKQKLEAANSRQEKMLRKYSSKWEELKKGAREKDKAKKEKAESAAKDAAAL